MKLSQLQRSSARRKKVWHLPNQITVLCVDDEANILRLRRMLLSIAGYAVLTATNADDAIGLFRRNSVDLVIIDQLLLGTTGTELAAQMKMFKPHVPIVLLTGLIEPPLEVGYIDLVLTKGMNPPDFLAAIAKLVAGSRSRQAGTS
jgi:two-component system, OmpR family, response regulator CpxR